MNRERRATGTNGYAFDLRFDPVAYLRSRLDQQGHARWLDLCRGAGWALHEVATSLADHPHADRLVIIGIDLVDAFALEVRRTLRVQCLARSWTDGPFPTNCDLITCVHGLHSLGDKLACLSKAAASLKQDGWLVANLDLSNIRIGHQTRSNRTLQRTFRECGWEYRPRIHILTRQGPQSRGFPFRYLGADDTVGPNSSGQPAVTSHYSESFPSQSIVARGFHRYVTRSVMATNGSRPHPELQLRVVDFWNANVFFGDWGTNVIGPLRRP